MPSSPNTTPPRSIGLGGFTHITTKVGLIILDTASTKGTHPFTLWSHVTSSGRRLWLAHGAMPGEVVERGEVWVVKRCTLKE